MGFELSPETRDRLLASIKRFAAEDLEVEMGDLKALLFLEFCLKGIGPTIYNQAVADAQRHLQARVEDMGAAVYQKEFGYWKR